MKALAFAPLVLMLAVLLFACGDPEVPDPDYVRDSKPCHNKAGQTTPCKAGKGTESQR
jgi:hypothetical protein